MGRDTTKRKAYKFLESYRLYSKGDLSRAKIIEILESQGYRIVYMNRLDNKETVKQLLHEIGCDNLSDNCKAFTYKDQTNRAVFIDGSLPDDDIIKVLLHEEGHIYCGHMDNENCSISNVSDEWEANEFAHYVLNPSLLIRIKGIVKKYEWGISFVIIVLAVFLIKKLFIN